MTEYNEVDVQPLRFGVIPLRFGAAAPEPILEARAFFYPSILRAVFKKEAKAVQEESWLTLAISLSELELDEHSAYRKCLRKAKSWDGQLDVLVVDIIPPLETLIPGRAELHLASALNILAAEEQGLRFVVFVDEMPPEREAFLKQLLGLVAEGRLTIIDRLGRCLPSSTALPQDFILLRKRASQDPLQRLELKLVRRLGHFQRPFEEGSLYCVRYFYDGSFCTKEISSLLKSHIASRTETHPPVLLYDYTVSKWIEPPVLDAARTLGTVAYNIRDVLRGVGFHDQITDCTVLVILPLVDTGKTAIKLLETWINQFGTPAPEFISVLSTEYYATEKKVSVLPNEQHGSLEIPYLMGVSRGLTPTERCDMCKLGIPRSSFQDDDLEMLTAFQFWTMVDEADWKEEDHVPQNRASMGLVPNFAKMFEENGGWLAQKACNRLVSFSEEQFPARPFVLLCPDEAGARVISNYLQVLHEGLTVVRLPEEALNPFRKGGADLEKVATSWRKERPKWYQQILEAAPTAAFVLVEEFCVSGGTRDALSLLLSTLGKTAQCHLAIVDFKEAERENSALETLSLYSFDEVAQINR